MAPSRRFVKAVFIALTGLGSSVSERVLVLVGILGAISDTLIALGLNGCRPTSSNDFLMFSLGEWLFDSLQKGMLVHCTEAIMSMVIKYLGIITLELCKTKHIKGLESMGCVVGGK